MATFTVSNTNDSGAGSLRQAIISANGAAGDDIIDFSIATGSTINLTSGELVISSGITFDADIDNNSATRDVTVNAGGASRVFSFVSGTSSIDNLLITGGNLAGDGGNLTNSGVANGKGENTQGAGIFNAGSLTLTNSTITANSAGGGGAGASSNGGGGGFGGFTGSTGGDGGVGGYGGTGGVGGVNSGGVGGTNDNGASPGNGGGGATNAGGGVGGLGENGGNNGGTGGTAGSAGGGGGGGAAGYSQSGGHGGHATGGIYNSGALVITDSTITSNLGAGGGGGGAGGGSAVAGNGGDGVGAITNSGGTLTISQSTIDTFSGNVGGGGGGGSGGGGTAGTSANNIDGAYTVSGTETTFVVNTTLDTGADATVTGDLAAETADGDGLSLREAVLLANPGDTITFDGSLDAATIKLVSGTLEIITGENLIIDGDLDNDNSADVTISGDANNSGTVNAGDVRVFTVQSGASLQLDGVVVSGGYDTGANGSNGTNGADQIPGSSSEGGNGTDGTDGGYAAGGILNAGALTLLNSTVSNSTAIGGTGGAGGDGGTGGVSLPNGNGYSGGAAGEGGAGGHAAGGILNLGTGTLTLTDASIIGITSTSGVGGVGGAGGDGGPAQGSQTDGGPARGGGAGGDGGVAAAIVNFALNLVNGVPTVSTNTLNAGAGGTGGTGGTGGAGQTGTGGTGGIGGSSDTAGSSGNNGSGGALGGTSGEISEVGDSGARGDGSGGGAGGGGGYTGLTAPEVVNVFAPVIRNLDGDSNTFTEGGSAVALDTNTAAAVSDEDDTEFNGGSLTVSLSANGTSSDQLSILATGDNTGEIDVDGANVEFGGSVIGTVAGGTNGTDLVVTFTTGSARENAVESLISALRFNNTGSPPNTSTRTIDVTLNDGDLPSATSQVTVTVDAANINPSVTLLPGDLSFTEDTAGNVALGAAVFADPDSDPVTVTLAV
ncbi:hypothetical protein, partial [Phaeobacter gallaeciensis]|uniref:beta strand repeat-containing protein n=2 Tax=Roseobacteraceae TaxID=2854170 RepID=UPI0015F084B3